MTTKITLRIDGMSRKEEEVEGATRVVVHPEAPGVLVTEEVISDQRDT